MRPRIPVSGSAASRRAGESVLLDRPASRWYAADSAIGLRSRHVLLRAEPSDPLNTDPALVEQSRLGGDMVLIDADADTGAVGAGLVFAARLGAPNREVDPDRPG